MRHEVNTVFVHKAFTKIIVLISDDTEPSSGRADTIATIFSRANEGADVVAD